MAVTDTALDNAHVPGAVTALLAEYAHCIDDDRIEEWPGLFTDPCLYRITTRDNHARGFPASIMMCDSRGMLMDRVVSVRTANVFEPHRYRHIVSCIQVVESGEASWRLRSNYLVTRTMRDGTMAVFSTGEYQDRIVLDEGEPRFNERIVICDHGMINNLIALPL
jgi:anthranilate 1,2-dioxygenase small subunit